MLKYKILKTNNNFIEVPIELKNLDITSPSNEYEVTKKSIVSYEKNGYENINPYKLNFYIHTNNGYELKLDSLFDFKSEINKNVFKKSNIVLEFYEQGETFTWIGSESLPLRNGLYVPPKSERVILNGATSSRYGFNNITQRFDPIFTIDRESTFLSELYFYREFKQFKDVVDGEGRIFMRAMLQNAKTGVRHYFINGNDNMNYVNKESNYSFYHEIRCKSDNTYYFIHNGVEINKIIFKEMVGK